MRDTGPGASLGAGWLSCRDFTETLMRRDRHRPGDRRLRRSRLENLKSAAINGTRGSPRRL